MDKLDELVSKSKEYAADVNKIIIDYIINTIEYMNQSQLDLALDMLQHCEEIILSASKQCILIESEVLSLTSHTFALYYYQ